MTQHSAASHRARVWKQEADALRTALELEAENHEQTRRDLTLSRAALDIVRAEAADGRRLRAELISLLSRHGIEV